jgi:hypothetical protein
MNGTSSRETVGRTEIPSSIEIISLSSFHSHSSLSEVIFASNCRLKEIRRLSGCRSLRRIQNLPSLEVTFFNPSLNAACSAEWSSRQKFIRERIWVSEDRDSSSFMTMVTCVACVIIGIFSYRSDDCKIIAWESSKGNQSQDALIPEEPEIRNGWAAPTRSRAASRVQSALTVICLKLPLRPIEICRFSSSLFQRMNAESPIGSSMWISWNKSDCKHSHHSRCRFRMPCD